MQAVIAHGYRVAYAQSGPVPSRYESRAAMDQRILVAVPSALHRVTSASPTGKTIACARCSS
jgi:hypothetical protein